MPSKTVILSGSRDAHLLQVRNEVLKVPGYTVVSAYSPEELLETFRAGDFDLVLLCHSFTAKEQSKIALAIHAQSPSTPVIVMSPSVVSIGERASANADAIVPNDPASLLNAITAVTSHQVDWRGRVS
jgi:DNA-binding response OmpR family regulator